LTTALYRGRLIVDPTAEEEALATTAVTVCLDGDGSVVAVLKPGGDAEATESQIAHCVAAARARYETLRRALRDAFGEDV
jgi:exosome complex RNA-binding protein Rrp42 (RNase PH superfamily)